MPRRDRARVAAREVLLIVLLAIFFAIMLVRCSDDDRDAAGSCATPTANPRSNTATARPQQQQPHQRRLVRRLFERRRPQVANLTGEPTMMGIEWLKPAIFFGSILYALIGVLVFWISFLIVDKVTPYDLWDEIVRQKNVALAIVAPGSRSRSG
jgi:hypothetical protein